MKTILRFAALVSVAPVMALISASAFSQSSPLPNHANSGVKGTEAVVPSAFITAQPVSTPTYENISASWDEIKDYSYEKRMEFGAGLRKLEARVDAQVNELNAKRQTMKADPKNWDFAMKEMIEAQAYLKSMASEARKANEETWDDRKEKARLAWVRAQEAYGKVLASTTT